VAREDGWRGFRIEGVLDFSLIGILSLISTILADNQIGIFAVSTYNTDYILVKDENFDRAMDPLLMMEWRQIQSKTLDRSFTKWLICTKLKQHLGFAGNHSIAGDDYVFYQTAYSPRGRTEGEKQQGHPPDRFKTGGKIHIIQTSVFRCEPGDI
jgi:hypothetical protein